MKIKPDFKQRMAEFLATEALDNPTEAPYRADTLLKLMCSFADFHKIIADSILMANEQRRGDGVLYSMFTMGYRAGLRVGDWEVPLHRPPLVTDEALEAMVQCDGMTRVTVLNYMRDLRDKYEQAR